MWFGHSSTGYIAAVFTMGVKENNKFMTVFTMTLWRLSYCYEYLRIGNTDVRSAVLASAECINIL